MKSEADIKRAMIKSIKELGGYARRIEDQYAVGILDTLLIPVGLPVFLAEVKRIKGESFGPTPRQKIEMDRVIAAANKRGHVIPILIGWKDGVYYFHKPADVVKCCDCFSVTTSDMPFHQQLVQYYYSQKG